MKIVVQIPPYPGQNAVQMPHTGVHSGDQMPPPRGLFTDTKMTEGRRKRLQLSNYKVTECSALIFFVMQHKKRSIKKDPTY